MITNCLQLHLIRKCFFAGENVLALQIGVHHGDHGLIVRHLPHDHRHGRQPELLTGGQSPVAGHQFVAAVRRGTGKTRRENADLADALHDPLHFLIVLNFERMILEGAQPRQREQHDALQLFAVPFLLRSEQVIQTGEQTANIILAFYRT